MGSCLNFQHSFNSESDVGKATSCKPTSLMPPHGFAQFSLKQFMANTLHQLKKHVVEDKRQDELTAIHTNGMTKT
jgi:hypothetical protein